ncbi:MAG: maturation protein, partial [Pseudomonas alloputida]
MRKLFLLLVMAVSPAAFAERVEFANTALEDVVRFVGPKFDHPIIIGADLSNKKISLYGSYETPEQLEFLLQRAVESVGLNYVIAADVATISSVKMPDVAEKFDAPDFLQGNTGTAPMIVMPPDQPVVAAEEPAINHVYALRYAQSAYVVDELAPAFAQGKGEGRPLLISLATSNSVVFAGSKAQFELMNTLVGEIDKPRQQVLITAVVAELSDNNFRSLGANLKGAFGDVKLASVTMASRSDLGTELTFSGPKLSAFVQAVENSGDSKVLSTPQLLVLNREKASIVVGQNVP